MTVAAGVLAVALVAVVYLMLRHHAQAEAAWVLERRELLNRIQRPDRIPVQAPEHYPVPDEPVDEIDLVGTIHNSEV